MLYVFDDFSLDASKFELRRDREIVAIEPQVFALLLLLVENRERLVSKDEIVEKVWDGRAVSESAITSRIKSARRALGDDGKAQRYIRTIHGHGVRFVADVRSVACVPAIAAAPACPEQPQTKASEAVRPSIAVLPFRLLGVAGAHTAIADAIPHDLIAALSRLRWLFVIARGSSFRFRAMDLDVVEIGSILNVSYCLCGAVEIFANQMNITVELVDTRNRGTVWGERFSARVDDIHLIRDQIVSSIVAALEIQITHNEAHLARLTTPENLDAWSAYHLGLQHMYRFNKKDNAAATALFETAIAREPGFARAYAGLSFTSFQNAFLRYCDDPETETSNARRFAEQGVELDPLDPFANVTMGRAFWLTGDLEGSLGWLERSTALSPNFAQGFYARAWADTISGRALEGQAHVDVALALSPLDPLRYAMLATRALSCVEKEDYGQAAHWADLAARTPGAHVLIALIAVIAHSLNGDPERAAAWTREVRSRRADLTRMHFFCSFPYHEGGLRQRISSTLSRHGF